MALMLGPSSWFCLSLQTNGGPRWFSPERTSGFLLRGFRWCHCRTSGTECHCLRKQESRLSRHSTKLDCCLRRNSKWCHSAEVLRFWFRVPGFWLTLEMDYRMPLIVRPTYFFAKNRERGRKLCEKVKNDFRTPDASPGGVRTPETTCPLAARRNPRSRLGKIRATDLPERLSRHFPSPRTSAAVPNRTGLLWTNRIALDKKGELGNIFLQEQPFQGGNYIIPKRGIPTENGPSGPSDFYKRPCQTTLSVPFCRQRETFPCFGTVG